MLTLYQFQGLSFDTQAEYVWDKGVVIADRFDQGYKILLYHMGPFYVEVWYNGEKWFRVPLLLKEEEVHLFL